MCPVQGAGGATLSFVEPLRKAHVPVPLLRRCTSLHTLSLPDLLAWPRTYIPTSTRPSLSPFPPVFPSTSLSLFHHPASPRLRPNLNRHIIQPFNLFNILAR